MRLDRNAGGHERQGRSAHRGHGGGAVRLKHFGHDANGIGKALFIGQYGCKRPFREIAMADFATAYRAEPLDLSHRIRRKIVMQHVGFFIGALDIVDTLLIKLGPERRRHEHLRFAAGKKCGTVSARQDIEVAGNRPDLIETPAADADASVSELFCGCRRFPDHGKSPRFSSRTPGIFRQAVCTSSSSFLTPAYRTFLSPLKLGS